MSHEINNIPAGDIDRSADSEQTYTVIRNSVIAAQGRIYTAVNSAIFR